MQASITRNTADNRLFIYSSVKLYFVDLYYDFASQGHDLSGLDFTEPDNTDPLGVDEFAKKKALFYHDGKLSTVRVVKYKDETVGFFAVSMFAISVQQLARDERMVEATPVRYPAMLLGQLGVDKKHRGKGIAKEMLKFCFGLAREAGEDVACRYIVLQTGVDKTRLYENFDFVQSPKKPEGGKIWMYTKIF